MKLSEKFADGIISLWRTQSAERQATANLKRMSASLLRSVNKHLTNFGCMEQFDPTQFDENYVEAEGVIIHACIPNYPSKYSVMGIFLVRVDAVAPATNETRFVINLEKLNTPKKIAKAIMDILKSPVSKSKEFVLDGRLLTESQAKDIMVANF